MRKLQEIAEDYCKVKNYVYQRYGGVRGLTKLYPGYTVQNEMTGSGLRAQLGLPSVYFYLAVFEALGDVKAQWAKVKKSIMEAINTNERFTPEDRHYLRFVLKVSSCFDNILNGEEVVIPEAMKGQYQSIIAEMSLNSVAEDAAVNSSMEYVADHKKSLDQYLCRQVRKRLHKLCAKKANGFAVTERAYRYGDRDGEEGIFVSVKENRKRIFIPLTDGNRYSRQLYVKLNSEDNSIAIDVPIEIKVRTHRDYINEIGLSVGIWRMFTTDTGNVYGEQFGEKHQEFVEFIRAANRTYLREKNNNPGREKYKKRKARLDAGLEAYVNQEINRMLAIEKPQVIYLPKLPKSVPNRYKTRSWNGSGQQGRINYSVNVWRRGFVRLRLKQKCWEKSIKIVEVPSKAISTECSSCGAIGRYSKDIFRCENCGYEADKKTNAAQNAMKRGRMGQ